MEVIKLLEQLSMQNGVSGFEKQISAFVASIFRAYCDEVEIDRFSNVIGVKKGYGSGKRKIMITAHYDEIGLIVTGIDEHGFIKFSSIGGIDNKILPAQEVIVHGKEELFGVIGAKPPHLIDESQAGTAVKQEDMCVDLGMSADSVKEKVSIGDIITFNASPTVLKNSLFSSKALDNRSGVASLVMILELLKDIKHKDDVYVIATVQEEVGLRGAEMVAYSQKPDFAIVIDVCHGDMPDVSEDEAFSLGKGVALGVGPNLHKGYTNKAKLLAEELGIGTHIEVSPGSTGTEAWAVQISRTGVPTVLFSIPLRYMHTMVETLSIKDIKATARLAVELIKMGVLD